MRIFTISAVTLNDRDEPAELDGEFSGSTLDHAELADLAVAVLGEMNERFGVESGADGPVKAAMAATLDGFDQTLDALRESGVQF